MAALVLMCGVPASGKTTVARRLQALIEADNRPVTIVSDGDTALPSTTATTTNVSENSPSQSRQALYANAHCEKQTRARLRTLAERALWQPGHVVIVDSLNYIKGFRYELYCVAKTANSSYIVIHTTASDSICQARDAARQQKRQQQKEQHVNDDGNDDGNDNGKKSGNGEADDDSGNEEDNWGGKLLSELTSRFEAPRATNRWDRPLFTIDTTTTKATSEDDPEREQSLRTIVDTLKSPTAARLHATMATREQNAPAVDAVADIDAATRAAESVLLGHLRRGDVGIGDSVRIPNASLPIRLQRKPRATELRDMRRAFLNYSRLHPPSDTDMKTASLVDAYVQYVNEQLMIHRR